MMATAVEAMATGVIGLIAVGIRRMVTIDEQHGPIAHADKFGHVLRCTGRDDTDAQHEHEQREGRQACRAAQAFQAQPM